MNVTLRLFAAAKQIAGSDLVTLDVPGPGTIADVRQSLLDRFPQLQPLADHLRFSINAEYARDQDSVVESDEIACIPPVSGG